MKTCGYELKSQIKIWNKRADTWCWWHANFFRRYTWQSLSLYLKTKTINRGFRWSSRHGACSTLKLKLFDISRRSHPVKFFSITSHLTCSKNYLYNKSTGKFYDKYIEQLQEKDLYHSWKTFSIRLTILILHC